MKTIQRFKLAAAAVAIGLSFSAVAATPAASGDASRPSVVIVHGAFADGSDWAKVIPLLQAKGLRVVAVQNPLSSLEDDVAAAKRAIDAQPGKVVLIGHSWGGSVITEAGANDKVASLVYVAAFAPDAGQNTAELGKDYPPAPGFAHIVPDASGYLSLTKEGMTKHFAQDLPASATAVMTATQGPIFGKSFEQKLTVAAWKTRPSWYLATSADHMIQPALQLDMAKKIGAHLTRVNASHVPQQSQPAKVAEVILDAVRQSK
ncbi:alpha/beta hydrolase [Variovorax sp. NFACC27]|uniref:alpha/beta fold hydrolase n=1 Tax=unclassified Variovorax TaxID=663243 RepID=UPI00089BE9F1|nr:Pimeloyl-ACP methyl ester carboxylesterase [Variovorax sp. NFACC28]SEG84097.1 Pimeloyl-ACP methyl ester carboxylesterase [Variovorax sp. NFACC29]SFD16311.1 Pimeloyl-ACP methyl ester carboxylesterase [Variovorax sp. NFACC26]SFG24130.1 Pimeloyl-ACP methyl ester carboxylesterase [Variovorax sp. NFACC27]